MKEPLKAREYLKLDVSTAKHPVKQLIMNARMDARMELA
mgnify:CR=1 FL=1